MITAKNYSAQAYRDLMEISQAEFNYTDTNEELVKMAELIKDAVHFALPDNGRFFESDLSSLKDSELNLPFPLITLEYFVPVLNEDSKAKGHIHVSKRLIIAKELSPEELQGFLSSSRSFDFDTSKGGIYLTTVISSKDLSGGYWAPDGIMVLIPKVSDPETGKFSFRCLPSIRDSWEHTWSKLPDPFGEMNENARYECYVLAHFIEALLCTNVKSEVLQEASPANAKRIRQGKLPIYETRCLTIALPGGDKQPSIRLDADSVMTSNGVRQHLRRGHIRRLPSGKRTWVSSCVVGSASLGVIEKNYACTTK